MPEELITRVEVASRMVRTGKLSVGKYIMSIRQACNMFLDADKERKVGDPGEAPMDWSEDPSYRTPRGVDPRDATNDVDID